MKYPTIALLFAVLTAPTSAENLWDEVQARAEAPSSLTAPLVVELLELSPLLPYGAMSQRIGQLLSDESLPMPARERVVRDFAYQLRDRSPDLVVWRLLEQLAGYTANVLVAHPESRGQYGVPLFDVAIAARGTMNQWTRVFARDTAERAVTSGDIDELAALVESGHRQQIAGAADAMRYGESEAVRSLAVEMANQLTQTPQLTSLVLAAGERLHDPALLSAVIEHGTAPWRVQTLVRLAELIDGDDAMDLWMQHAAGGDPELAAAALVQLGSHIEHDPGITVLIEKSLTRPDSGSAAALVLSRLNNDVVIERMAWTLKHSTDDLARRRALLVLRMSEHPMAGQALAQFVAKTDDSLAVEARKWLR